MSTTTNSTNDGGPDVNSGQPKKDTPSLLNQAAKSLVTILALQRSEWTEMQSVPGLSVRLINFSDPNSGRQKLGVEFSVADFDLTCDDATGEIFLNGRNIDDIFPEVITQELEKEGAHEETD